MVTRGGTPYTSPYRNGVPKGIYVFDEHSSPDSAAVSLKVAMRHCSTACLTRKLTRWPRQNSSRAGFPPGPPDKKPYRSCYHSGQVQGIGGEGGKGSGKGSPYRHFLAS
jgi:hypothetical protein